jgi:hypothetical protein
MTKKFPPPLLSADRKRYLAVAFGAPDDAQTVDAIPDKFDRQRCRARIAFEKERNRLANEATYRYHGSKSGSFDGIEEKDAIAKATQFIVEAYDEIETYARVALRYPALVRNDPRLRELLLDPWFESEGASS